MTYYLGKRSLGNLEGVHPNLIKVVKLAIKKTKQDFMVVEGVRTQRRQWELYARGRHVAELRAKGCPMDIIAQPMKPKVTWVTHSNHMPKEDGYGHAVDLVPYPVDWNHTEKFDAISDAMFAASEELGIPIRWGADWDRDGKPRERGETDSPHFELA